MKRVTAASLALLALLAGCFSPVAPELPGDDPNTPPSATLTAEQTIFLGDEFSGTIAATDADGDSLSWVVSVLSIPADSSLDADAITVAGETITFTPDVVGSYTVRVVVSDGSESVTLELTLSVVSGAPAPPSAPVPSDDAVGVGVTAGLAWAEAAGASEYRLFLGAGELPDEPVTLASPSFDPTLDYSTTYLWQVIAVNQYGESAGPVWSFTTQDEPQAPPPEPSGPSPSDGATGVVPEAGTLTLAWEETQGAASYTVRWRVSGDDVWTEVSDLGATSHTPEDGAILFDTSYEWQVTAVNGAGATDGPVWSFRTAFPVPEEPTPISPENGARDLLPNLVLDWNDAADAQTYDVYLGAGQTEPQLVASGLTESRYQPAYPDQVDFGMSYRWYVVARNPDAESAGQISGFSTAQERLEGHWTLDLEERGLLPDSSGNGYSASVLNADVPTFVDDGRFDRAVRLSQANLEAISVPLAEFPDAPIHSSTNGYSVSLWFREPGDTNDVGALFGKEELLVRAGDTYGGLALGYSSADGVEVLFDGVVPSDGQSTARIGIGEFPAGEWNHLVVVWDPEGEGAVRAWANGRAAFEVKGVTPFTDTTADILIGAAQSVGATFNGDIDDVRVYTRAIAEFEVDALFNGK